MRADVSVRRRWSSTRERGYEQATVAEIADRAGLTARTFFRYFADKREVLFAGSDALGEQLLVALDAAPATDAPFAAVVAALSVVADAHRWRSRILVATPGGHRRERRAEGAGAGQARLVVPGAGRRAGSTRGGGPAASLAAETGVAVFRVAFERWLGGPAGRTLVDTLHETVDQLRAITYAG